MANQSFNQTHPCDSSFLHCDTMPNDKQDSTGSNVLVAETRQRHSNLNQSQHLLSDDLANLYNYQSAFMKDSPSMLSLVSRSVPNSRRNSDSDTNQPLEFLFSSKLQVENTSQKPSPTPESNHSMKSTLRSAFTATQPTRQLSSPNDGTRNYGPTTTLEGANSVFQKRSLQLPQNPTSHQYQSPSFAPTNDYNDLFNMQNAPMGYEKNLQALRSKSWTEYLDHPTNNHGMYPHDTSTEAGANHHLYMPESSTYNNRINASATSYNSTLPRRSSYGWQHSDSARYQGFYPDLSGIKTRLTTSQSHSDLRATSINNGTQQTGSTAASFGFYNGSSDVLGKGNNEQLAPLCQQ
ncbi:hypothetical protein BC941DRAFT_416338, partial [Chlamydoabsidia padenii]